MESIRLFWVGNLFGTTIGNVYFNNYSTVFEIPKTPAGSFGVPITLVTFDNTNGAYPYAVFIVGANGDLL